MAISFSKNTALRTSLGLFLCLQFFPLLASAIAPPANVRGTETAQSTVTWEWDTVADAAQYEITLDGLYSNVTAASEYTSGGMWAGDHSLRVRAISADSRYSFASQTAMIRVRAVHEANIANRIGTIADEPPVVESADVESTVEQAAVEQAAVEQVATNQVAEPAVVETQAAVDQGLVDPASLSMPEVQQKAGYELIFSDEFNGSSLNPSRWNTQLRWDGEFNGVRYEYRITNGESQFYVNTFSKDQNHLSTVVPNHNPFEFDGTRLAIRAKRNPMKSTNSNNDFGSLNDMFSKQEFLSGVLSTYDKFSRKYGYYEARMKIPSHNGTFPAFWLHHQNQRGGTRKTEIDIMENLGHKPQYVYNTFHYYTNVRSDGTGGDGHLVKPNPTNQIYTGTDYSQDYHVYAVNWEPGKITWFIDGQKVSELSSGHSDYEDLYLMINLAMGGNWTNGATNGGGLGRRYPSANDLENFNNPALEIDYVRVYKHQ